MNLKVIVTPDLDTTCDDSATDPFRAANAKMFGNATFDEMSIGIFVASHDESPTDTLDDLCEATFVKPLIEHDIGNGPEGIAEASESLTTRRGSEAEGTYVAEPKARPCW